MAAPMSTGGGEEGRRRGGGGGGTEANVEALFVEEEVVGLDVGVNAAQAGVEDPKADGTGDANVADEVGEVRRVEREAAEVISQAEGELVFEDIAGVYHVLGVDALKGGEVALVLDEELREG